MGGGESKAADPYADPLLFEREPGINQADIDREVRLARVMAEVLGEGEEAELAVGEMIWVVASPAHPEFGEPFEEEDCISFMPSTHRWQARLPSKRCQASERCKQPGEPPALRC